MRSKNEVFKVSSAVITPREARSIVYAPRWLIVLWLIILAGRLQDGAMRAISLATATALGLFLAPAAAYRLALPVSAAAQPPRAACSTAGRAARASSIDMIGGNNLDGTGSFRTVQEYPCDLDVKIIGANEGPFVDDMVTLCAERTGQKEEDISAAAWCRRRRSGSGRADRPRRHGSRRPPACARSCPLGTRAEL